jgi:hypothetical protein
MSLLISSVFTYDEDASDYILAVEAADGQTLEPLTRKAINEFVLGCKADGIWTAIKASCILAGARTLAGALVPLVGTAPTNGGPFVSGDYNRKTGLVGDGATKYLDSNRAGNTDAQNNVHQGLYVSTADPPATKLYLGGTSGPGGFSLGVANNVLFTRNQSDAFSLSSTSSSTTGFLGTTRSESASYATRFAGNAVTVATASQPPAANNIWVFAQNGGSYYSNARLSYYSIGSALDLAKLDARVTQLMARFAAVIV